LTYAPKASVVLTAVDGPLISASSPVSALPPLIEPSREADVGVALPATTTMPDATVPVTAASVAAVPLPTCSVSAVSLVTVVF
jgi:hypothetical protein